MAATVLRHESTQDLDLRQDHQLYPPPQSDPLHTYMQGMNVDRRLQQGMEKVQSLCELNPNNQLLTPERWGGSSIWAHALCAVNQDHHGNIICAGYYTGEIATDTIICVAKNAQENGNIIWAKQFVSHEDDELCQVVITDANDILIVGTVGCTSEDEQRFMVMKISQHGEIEYRHIYDLPYPCIAIDAALNHYGDKLFIVGATGHVGAANTENHSLKINVCDGSIDSAKTPPSYTQTVDIASAYSQGKVTHCFVGDMAPDDISMITRRVTGNAQKALFNTDNMQEFVNEYHMLTEMLAQFEDDLAKKPWIDVASLAKEAWAWLQGVMHNVSDWLIANVETIKQIQQARVAIATQQASAGLQTQQSKSGNPLTSTYAKSSAMLDMILDKAAASATVANKSSHRKLTSVKDLRQEKHGRTQAIFAAKQASNNEQPLDTGIAENNPATFKI